MTIVEHGARARARYQKKLKARRAKQRELNKMSPEEIFDLQRQHVQAHMDYWKESEKPDIIKAIATADPVNHPSHYNSGKIEVIEFIEDQKLGFHLGNVVKYTSRAGKKFPYDMTEDLKKAKWYLERKIELISAAAQDREPVRPNAMNAQELRAAQDEINKKSAEIQQTMISKQSTTTSTRNTVSTK